jgi:iron complex transport system ATP-binding protein
MSLVAEKLEVRYGSELAVRQTSLRFEPGELIGLIGPNGAGKTSLLRALAGLPQARAEVSWQGRPLGNLGNPERARAIAYLPQAPQIGWPLAVRDMVELGRLPHRRFGERLSPDDDRAIASALARTGMTNLAGRAMDRLSGGERMRAHLARAFAVEAPALLVDEPTASLDPYYQISIMRLLSEYRDRGGLVVAVLHDLNLALGHCSRLILMDRGEIVGDGEPHAVINAVSLARHYRVRAFLAEYENRRLAVPWDVLDRDD